MENSRSRFHLVFRMAVAVLGAGILIWLVIELRAGAVHWNVADYVSNETIGQYAALSFRAKLAATFLFGLLSLGLIAYGLFPRLVLNMFIVIPWLLIMVALGLLLKPLSQRMGP